MQLDCFTNRERIKNPHESDYLQEQWNNDTGSQSN